MTDTTFVYTLSSRNTLVRHATHSIQTLKQYVDPVDITVIFTPPVKKKDVEAIKSLGVYVKKQDRLTDDFSIVSLDSGGAYAEKVRCCEVNSDTVVFLDCDTLVLNDIWEVVAGDFDFKARPSPETPQETDWKRTFDRFGEEYLDFMPNAGFLVFKNNTHKEIRDDWLRYIQADIKSEFSGASYVDQWALALAVSGYNCQEMDPNEHAIEWHNGCVANACVHHLYTRKGISLHDALRSPINTIKRLL